MGIVNVTPDSFSDGGRYLDVRAAVAHAERLIAEGADILDVGGESTRPGAAPLSADDEIARVIPVIQGIGAVADLPISIDTMKPQVARAAVAAGATIWNDVSGLAHAPHSPAVAADLGCEVILMHMRGDPATMHRHARYADVAGEVAAELTARAETAVAAGVPRAKLWLDPGLGFAKTAEQSLELLRRLPELVALGYPVLLGASRKSFLKAIDPTALDPADRLPGSLAAALRGATAGAAALRVHDVKETVQALNLWAATA